MSQERNSNLANQVLEAASRAEDQRLFRDIVPLVEPLVEQLSDDERRALGQEIRTLEEGEEVLSRTLRDYLDPPPGGS